ncbi:glycosyltransferase [Frondihabitans australicus]|uniref:Cellulose synthase/poly-beta-1,6-N-acetylglucosamine synthase-like glycosyltransferase n=1 Tax=Frondihabitans australicus TaxID=386892 RepID=A0A495IHX2_9MICO|nr:glycosyltransferase [Frondihabitans australicus]RKR74706.1 cellulose synthase/poly-beta-1,6-N-acetylglucosamine synthase-like glycosyltransferase [Frondihabitans australicus]
MSLVFAAISAIAAIVICLSLVYFLAAMLAGMHELRKGKTKLAVQGDTTYGKPFESEPATFDTYFLIPGLNEAAVISQTVASLTGGKRSTVIMIDDGSDDDTAALAEAAGGDDTIVLRRVAPNARQGKGEALNDAYRLVERLVTERGQDPEKVLICVMDADGKLSDGAMSHVLPLFDDPTVGGVQLAVRIRNRRTNFLTSFQDFQFWSMSAITQFGRKKTGTVSLGGNGQFTRLSALQELGGLPWSSSLTEDLDLALSLATSGWKLDTTPFASVDQQAVESLKRLIIQRRRWYQGHMTAGKRIVDVWRDPTLNNARALELSAYLAVPWLFDLPWSILWHWTLYGFITNAGSVFSYVTGWQSAIIGGFLWYVLTFAPSLMTTTVYFRRDRRVGLPRAILMGHAFLVMNYLSFICAWGALYRMIRGRTGWDKTVRVVEGEAGAAAPAAGATPARRATTLVVEAEAPVAAGPAIESAPSAASASDDVSENAQVVPTIAAPAPITVVTPALPVMKRDRQRLRARVTAGVAA